MNVEKINKISHKPRILLAPLDWGLGHATRCIPLIRLLIKNGAEIIIAAEGAGSALLKQELPELLILPLKGYRIRYSNNRFFFVAKLLLQISKIISAIRYEKKWLDKNIAFHGIDAVISDNRFGFYSKKIPSIYITHQLFIETGVSWLNGLAQKINYHYINKFSECWVPDNDGKYNLAGKLSHPKILPRIPVKYLGLTSRCEKIHVQKEIDLLILISGPEPQRSSFEKILLMQLKAMNCSVILVRGLPGVATKPVSENKHISIFNHLPATELNKLIQASELVVARCGYSTIMDLISLQQKAILIPTPGQAEQEYLGKYLKEKGIFFSVAQKDFSLEADMEKIKSFVFAETEINATMNEQLIVEWLEKISPGAEQVLQ